MHFSLMFLLSLPPSASLSLVVNCTEPGQVENSIRQVLPSGPHRYSFQTTVSYRCNPGYYLLGTSSISCQGDGTWDRSLPKCLCEYLAGWLLVVLHDVHILLIHCWRGQWNCFHWVIQNKYLWSKNVFSFFKTFCRVLLNPGNLFNMWCIDRHCPWRGSTCSLSLSLISLLWLDSGVVWPPQHASLRPDLRRPSDSGLSHPLQLHRPAYHHRQHNAHVPAGRPVERLATTLLRYGKLHPVGKFWKIVIASFCNSFQIYALIVESMCRWSPFSHPLSS